MQRRRRRVVAVIRKMLTCAICAIAMVALVSVHVHLHVFPLSAVPDFPDRYRLPFTTQRSSYFGSNTSKSKAGRASKLRRITSPLRKRPFLLARLGQLVGAGKTPDLIKQLWRHPSNRDYSPCVDPTPNYTSPGESRGFLLVHTNGGLNQMRAGICDMVAVARIINATLVVPELDKRSFWHDSSNFSDVFDEDHFINALANDVKVVKKLPKHMAGATKAVKYFRSWSGMDYYQDEIASLWEQYQVIRAAKSDSRLANNNLPVDIQKLRCRACYGALRFAPRIEALGKLLVDRMRSYGPYIALHLRYEKDMLAFSGCTHDLSPAEADELKTIREETAYWKVKEIDSREQRSKGLCPLTPKEVAMFLTALGYPSSTPIYIAAGNIYGGDSHMVELRSRYPLLMTKEKLASIEELEPFADHQSQKAALDYIVSVESDVFIPTYSGNMAMTVEGHRRFLGHRRTISPDRKALVRLFDKIERGKLKEGRTLSNQILEIHKKRQGSPRKRKGPISGTKGSERFRSEEAFYVNPLPDCLCQKPSTHANSSLTIRDNISIVAYFLSTTNISFVKCSKKLAKFIWSGQVAIRCSKAEPDDTSDNGFRRREVLQCFGATVGMELLASSGSFVEVASAADLIQRRQRSEFQSSVKETLSTAIEGKPELVPSLLKLALNDAMTYDKPTKTGGPNGSIRFSSEISRPENEGLSAVLSLLEEAKKEIDSYSKGGPISFADLIHFAAQSALKATFLASAIRKCGGNEEKGRTLYRAYGSSGQWGLFDKQFGRADADTPDPEGRVPQWEKASVQEMKDKFKALGLGPRQLAVMSAFLGPDQAATEALLATDPEVLPWVQKYQRSRETVSQTDYEVDLITTFTKISSLGQQINYEAYTYPVKKIELSKLKL
ncbi:hypothetical protein Tsubulata_016339 [Turnera subulata]|uniref:Thylakoid lumenal 29 kDa protein, chloroplastic n=1 Tax=Turnera subulata TaxID=218843 RepID=A0A9Q0G5J0_9ROSI|nr:hypothetical protein Tsubulata_016339 [Turnera subulata]